MIGVDGSQLGLFGVRDALRIANDQGLDLVEIAPNAEPPVCKVLDYKQFKYEQDRKAKAARKNQVKVEIKEMKFRPKIDVGDYETKKGHVMRFLKKGARVKITIMFRGREMAHPEQGRIVLDRLAEDLKPYATVESKPQMEGRNMHMLIVPIKGAFDDVAIADEEVSHEIMRAKAFKSHILTKKSQKRIRGFRQETVLAPSDVHTVSQRMGK